MSDQNQHANNNCNTNNNNNNNTNNNSQRPMAPPPSPQVKDKPTRTCENDMNGLRWSFNKSLADALSSSLADIAKQEAALKFPPPTSGNNSDQHVVTVTTNIATSSGDSSEEYRPGKPQHKRPIKENNDGMGLPYPIDERLPQRKQPHTLVVARLPPPSHKKDPIPDGSDGGYAGSASSNDLGETCSSTSSEEKKSPASSSYSSSNEEEVVDESDQSNKKRSFETMYKTTNPWQKSTRDQLEQEFKDAVNRACNRSLTIRRYQKSKYEEESNHILFDLSVDNIGTIMSFLDPREVHVLMTMPVSKTWRQTFTIPQDIWKILCISEPFYARVAENPNDNSDNSFSSFPRCEEGRHLIGRYRLLYTSFIRCMKYLARIKDDALNGRPPSGLDIQSSNNSHPFKNNTSLKNFFAKARELRHDSSSDSSSASWNGSTDHTDPSELTPDSQVGGSDDDSMNKVQKSAKKKKEKLKRKYGHSKLTGNLLGPSKGTGVPGHVDLPWSCAIYSIVNWMHAFQDVEGIQVMCLRVLPFLLEDETQRTTAQRAGLTDIVLRSMVLFPNSIELHTASFHTIVLLARPLGGREGMLFHSAMVNASGIFNVGSATGKNGIAVMIDSMRRFADDEVLQAMSCWSMVNIALIPSQKVILVKLGGIMVAADAMMRHPYNAEVQFRALFALINLVIPSDNEEDISPETMKDLGVEDMTEREILDENVNQITNLVVVAMKNFCSSEAILNRACLVLHNLSLNERYQTALLWTPNCYQMLEWCIGNYQHDQVLQHSAVGTLQRLQATLANDPDIRLRFSETMRMQQQNSLDQTRRDAALLNEQQVQIRNNLNLEE